MSVNKYLGVLHKHEETTKSDHRLINNILKEAQRNAITPTMLIFYNRYEAYPCTMDQYCDDTLYLPYEHVVKVLREEYKHDLTKDIVQYNRSVKNNFYKFDSTRLCDLGDGVMVFFNNGQLVGDLESTAKIEHAVNKLYHVFYGYKVMYLPEREEFAEKLMKSLEAALMKNKTEASLQMICKSQHGFYLNPIKIKKPTISDLKLHYGPEFENIHNTIVTALKADEAHGLILLHGLPGSGKTHYIRYLIQEITDKQLIYVPPDMTASISSPEFLPFMLQNTNSILIIEDAENIIKSRDSKESTTQAVANLLNLSDGLLGDSLHQPIIATFNCELKTIDSALLRKGRLITEYEFGKLDIESAQKLSDELGFKTEINEPMTLADIYGQEKAN